MTWINFLTTAVVLAGILLDASLSSPFPHDTLCKSADPEHTPCNPNHLSLPSSKLLNDKEVEGKKPSFSIPAQSATSIKGFHAGDLSQADHGPVSYSGYKLFRTDVAPAKLAVVDSLDASDGVDMWSWRKDERTQLYEIDLLTPPTAERKVKQVFTENNLRYTELIGDLQSAINEETKEEHYFSIWNRPAHPITFEKYHTHDEMNEYLDYLQGMFPSLVTVEEIGRSFENRSLRVAKVSQGGGVNRPIIFIDGGVHAREWISPATAVYVLQRLVEYSLEAPQLLSNFDWYILPVVNPDGYEYTHTHDRLWRKTRSTNPTAPGCVGTDANRNFGFKWASGGSSNNPCSIIYHGSEPFSEPETRALRDFLLKHRCQLGIYVSLHSYSQMWMTPWAYTYMPPANKQDLIDVGLQAVNAIKNYNGTEYTLGTTTELLYVATGSSMDYVYGEVGVPFVYTLELRDRGATGFILPKEQIRPSAEETFEGIKAMAMAVAQKPAAAKRSSCP